jgi:hypothetical protein
MLSSIGVWVSFGTSTNVSLRQCLREKRWFKFMDETKTQHFDIPRQIRTDPMTAALIRNGAREDDISVSDHLRHLIKAGIEHRLYCVSKRGFVRERPGPVRARPGLSGEKMA